MEVDEFKRTTMIQGIAFTAEHQVLARNLVHQRGIVREWQSQPEYGEVSNDAAHRAKVQHEKLAMEFAGIVKGSIGDGFSAMVEATKLVDDVFSI